MEDEYYTLAETARGCYREKGSRFLAFGFPVYNESTIKNILASYRKEYHDARHLCYAYRLSGDRESIGMHDDGEPPGTAAKPLSNLLIINNLTNVLILVVRYFGGVRLGTGRLAQSYRASAADMLAGARIIKRYHEDTFRLSFPYAAMQGVMKIIKDEHLTPVHQAFGETCGMTVSIRKSRSEALRSKFMAAGYIRVEQLTASACNSQDE